MTTGKTPDTNEETRKAPDPAAARDDAAQQDQHWHDPADESEDEEDLFNDIPV
ncbi:hypothetical protein [Nioella halotolerans]|uniref:hypothetical protein n=1 Tax=Nioella halotolerans TaxID=2303578 RepID=UPI0026AFA471